jgi:regulator of replication initiation timing
MGICSSRIAEIEHVRIESFISFMSSFNLKIPDVKPDIIKASVEDVNKAIQVLRGEIKSLSMVYSDLREKYVTYIGEEHMVEIENNPIWVNCTEPKFTRRFINSKDTKLLRDISTVHKQIKDIEFKIGDRQKDSEKLSERLAESMSLTSAHGQVHYMRFERDKAIEEKVHTLRFIEVSLGHGPLHMPSTQNVTT